jgi:hypothetical protein
LRLVFLIRALIDFPYKNSPISASTVNARANAKENINKCNIAKKNKMTKQKQKRYLPG